MSAPDIVERYRDTMGLTREGAIRRMHALMDRIEDDAATITALQAEVADWKQTAIAFGAPYMVQYAEAHGLPKNHLYDVHYDILERAGARMDDFTRAALERPKP